MSFYFNIGASDCKTYQLVSLTGRSLFCNRSAGIDEIVLADWLIYYIQVSLFVKVFVRLFSKLVLKFLRRTTLLFFRPVSWGESELYAFADFCQGLFQNSLACFLSATAFCFELFLTARRDYMQPGERVKRNLSDSELFKVKDSDSLRKTEPDALILPKGNPIGLSGQLRQRIY